MENKNKLSHHSRFELHKVKIYNNLQQQKSLQHLFGCWWYLFYTTIYWVKGNYMHSDERIQHKWTHFENQWCWKQEKREDVFKTTFSFSRQGVKNYQVSKKAWWRQHFKLCTLYLLPVLFYLMSTVPQLKTTNSDVCVCLLNYTSKNLKCHWHLQLIRIRSKFNLKIHITANSHRLTQKYF